MWVACKGGHGVTVAVLQIGWARLAALVALVASACTIWRGCMHEAHTMSTQDAHYVGPMRWGARGSGGGSGLGGRRQIVVAALAVLACTRQSLGVHETHIISTGVLIMWVPCVWKHGEAIEATLGRVKQVAMAALAASAHMRRRCGTHETHIMSMRVAHYVGPMRLGARGGRGGDGLGGLGRGRQTVTAAMAGVIWWRHVHKAHTTSTLGACFVGLVQMGGTGVCESGKAGTGARTYWGASRHTQERQLPMHVSGVWH
jgi:hypothetical protein